MFKIKYKPSMATDERYVILKKGWFFWKQVGITYSVENAMQMVEKFKRFP